MASFILDDSGDGVAEDDDILLDAADAAEEVADDADDPMDSDSVAAVAEEPAQESQVDDSIARFTLHRDSIFAIAQHPKDPSIIATGSGADETYVFKADPPAPLLPRSYESNPSGDNPRPSLSALVKLTGHSDSVNSLAFSLPGGAFLITGGLDGRIRIHATTDERYSLVAEAQEVPEINFLTPCPHPDHPNTFALGASDGSAWVYAVDSTDNANPLHIVQAYYLHTSPCTAGAWTPDGKLLATVSEDGSFYLWDVFGEAAALGLTGAQHQHLIGLTAEDQRFAIDGGLFSVGIAPTGTFAVVGGANGMIHVIALPRLTFEQDRSRKVGRNSSPLDYLSSASKPNQAGQILSTLHAQTDSIESFSFSASPLTLLATASVDGSIVLFDFAHRFAVRRHIRDAHEGFAVVQAEFVANQGNGGEAMLTSCGMDGVVRRWDARGGLASGEMGLVREWKGHRGGEGGGVLGFVQHGKRIVTAGDDALSLIFEE